MKLFILSHTLVLIKKIKGNKETSLVYFCYQSSNINCQKGNSYCEIAPTAGASHEPGGGGAERKGVAQR